MSTTKTTQVKRTSIYQPFTEILRRTFSFPVLLGALLVAGAFLALLGGLETVSSDPIAASKFWLQGDTWWHLAVGRQILTTHSWPRIDIYSFTMHGATWITYEWLGEVVMAVAWKIGHSQGLMALLTILSGTVTLLLFYYSYLRAKSATAAFLACAALLPLASLSFPLRPQLLGYAFLVITFIAVERFRQGRAKTLWALPLVFLLWVNTHGTFVLGFLLLGVYWISGLWEFRFGQIYAKRWTPTQRRQLEMVFLLCLIASVLTPYGTRLAAYPLKMFSSQHLIIQIVTEWQALPLSSLSGVIFVAALVIFCVALLTSRLSCELPDLMLLSFASTETLLHSRFILLFVPVFTPFLAELFAQWVPKRSTQGQRTLVNALLMACIGIAIIEFFPSRSRLQKAVRQTEPVEAAKFVRSHSHLGRMFTYYDWGSYLMFDLGPAHKVFMDGRLDLYQGSGVFQNYLAVYWTRPNMWAVLRKYHIRSCLALCGSGLATRMTASLQWKEIYRDPISVIFVNTRKYSIARLGDKMHMNGFHGNQSAFPLLAISSSKGPRDGKSSHHRQGLNR